MQTPAPVTGPADGPGAPPHDLPVVVNVTPFRDGNTFRWFEAQYAGRVRWEFFDATPRNAVERKVRRPDIALTRACWDAVRAACRDGARLMITHDPRVAFRCALFRRLLRGTFPVVAWSFNFAELPSPATRRIMATGLADVARFIVFSTVEREIYADAFGLPRDRFEMVHWSVNPPAVDRPDEPFESGDYICAIGGNARDYATLLAAMGMLPDIPLVLIMRPHNAAGLTIPANVRVHLNLPLGTTNNVLKFSRFMVLPLVSSEVPCGHVTIVNAMFLGKAFVITDSRGVHDYVEDDVNCLTCLPNSAEDLAAKVRALWDDPARADRLGTEGLRFARATCPESRMRDHLEGVLQEFGVLPAPVAAAQEPH